MLRLGTPIRFGGVSGCDSVVQLVRQSDPKIELQWIAERPACSLLDNAALRLSGLPSLPHYLEVLEPLVKELTS